jgi:hypothetical protein
VRNYVIIILTLVGFLSAPAVQAHYYAFYDADYGFNMDFPDNWKEQGGLPGDARVKLLAPGSDGAQCLVFAKKDRRFVIYPRTYMTDVVAQEIQWSYWEQAVANYDDLYFYYDRYGALGDSDARYTLVDYIDTTSEPNVRKRAWVHATLQGDLHMMTHCSSPIETFDSHAADFGQIVQSIHVDPAKYAPVYNGFYRDFLKQKQYGVHWHEPIVMFFLPRKNMSVAVNCPMSEDFEACLSKQKPLPIQTR